MKNLTKLGVGIPKYPIDLHQKKPEESFPKRENQVKREKVRKTNKKEKTSNLRNLKLDFFVKITYSMKAVYFCLGEELPKFEVEHLKKLPFLRNVTITL